MSEQTITTVANGNIEVPAAAPAVAVPPAQEQQARKVYDVARKERQVLEQRRAMQAEKQAWETERAQLAAKTKRYEDAIALAQQDPDKALQELGLGGYNSITERILAKGNLTPELALKASEERIAKLEAAQEARYQQLLEQQKTQVEQDEQNVISGYKEDLKSFFQAKDKDYPLTSLFDPSAEYAYKKIDQYFHETGRVLNHEEAGAMIEKEFRDYVDKANSKLGISKGQAPGGGKLPEPGAQQETVAPTARTLTNNMSGGLSPKSPARTEAEAFARAAALLER